MTFFLLIKPILVVLILAVFIVKLLLVAFYQQRSGHYFSNKMFYWYTKIEISSGAMASRTVMQKANLLNTILWALSILLVCMY